MTDSQNIPVGLCQCGCGEKTKLAGYTSTARGWVKGEPISYVHGHHARKLDAEYLVEDRGYETPCWIWQRAIQPNGYGHVPGGSAHRAYYTKLVGPIPDGLVIDHLCRNRACVNPDHLEAVPQWKNTQRGEGTRLTVEDVREIRRRRGSGETLRSIADDFATDQSHISKIARGLAWPEVN